MDPQQQREQLFRFIDALPQTTVDELSRKDVDIVALVHDIVVTHELVLYEMGDICEGVRRVLSGEESAANFLSSIQKDERIEEDNRPKLPALAYEIQTKVFDAVIPIFKWAGFPVQEGRVPAPAVKFKVASLKFKGGTTTPTPSLERRGGDTQPPLPPLEEKNMRALLRIAAGTNYTEGGLRNAFEGLPPGLRQSLSSVDTANAIQDIAKKYLLHVDQMAALASETGLVLLGLTHPADFIKNLTSRLRVPEERARDIARDISSQILAKVREALRGLHEESSKFEVRSSKNPTTTPLSPPLKGGEEPLRKLDVMPSSPDSSFAKGGAPSFRGTEDFEKSLPASEGGTPFTKGRILSTSRVLPLGKPARSPGAGGGELPMASTPFSPTAKWNTGENILSKQAAQKAESLSRAEVLRGIENPSTLQVPSSKFGGQLKTSPPANRRAGNLKLETLVGPTGWKPPAAPVPEHSSVRGTEDGRKFQVGSSKFQGNQEAQTLNAPQPTPPIPAPKPPAPPLRPPAASVPPSPPTPMNPTPALPKSPIPPPPAEKSRPSDEGTFPPVKPREEPQDFLDQKLQTPMSMPTEEKRYTTDPYREPLDS